MLKIRLATHAICHDIYHENWISWIGGWEVTRLLIEGEVRTYD